MTISTPDFDEKLHSHLAFVESGMCHAVTSDPSELHAYPSECGEASAAAFEDLPRKEFVDEDVEMCPDCWPAEVL